MLEREDFRERLSGGWKGQLFKSSEETTSGTENGKPNVKRPSSMAIHELLYPLLTALDAVELKSDVELGATEQKFNLLVHREIQREYGLPGQAILTMPILVGLDGQRKMSKSLGNYIGITEPPKDIFGKLMSIPDELMWSYMALLTDRSATTIESLRANVDAGTTHPKQVKVSLASEIVRDFYGEAAALEVAQEFQRVFSERQSPTDAPEKILTRDNYTASEQGKMKLSRALLRLDAAPSRAEAERLIKQGAVELDDVLITDPAYELDLNTPKKYLVKVGKKRFFYLVVQ